MQFLPAFIIGPFTKVAFVCNLLAWCIPLFLVAGPKHLLRNTFLHVHFSKLLLLVSSGWIAGNSFIIWLTQPLRWDVQGLELLPKNSWLLIVPNHRSWVDIAVLQKIFNRHLPFLEFFLKTELRKVPVLGACWRVLDFPFMGRYSRAEIEADPSLRNKDLETARDACRLFRRFPVSVVNFVEGTRFSERKRRKYGSPFRNLLEPRAGGIACAMEELGEQLAGIVNVTILYEPADATARDLFNKRIKKIVVRMELLPIPAALKCGDYANDAKCRADFQDWLNELWREKDAHIDKLFDQHPELAPR